MNFEFRLRRQSPPHCESCLLYTLELGSSGDPSAARAHGLLVFEAGSRGHMVKRAEAA